MITKRLSEDTILFSSHELALIAALVSWEFPIIKVERNNERATFFFEDSTELKQAILAYWNGTKMTLPIKYYEALRFCKSRIYGGNI